MRHKHEKLHQANLISLVGNIHIDDQSHCGFAAFPVFSPPDKLTKKPRGFTFVQYRRAEDASDAVRGMDGRVGCVCIGVLLELMHAIYFQGLCVRGCCVVSKRCWRVLVVFTIGKLPIGWIQIVVTGVNFSCVYASWYERLAWL